MKLSFAVQEAGFIPERIETTSEITLENNCIARSNLIVNAKISGIRDEVFGECIKDAMENCPISKVLNSIKTVETKLIR
jgi:osmotically inducible protein OsmC